MNKSFKMDKISKTIIFILLIYFVVVLAIYIPIYLNRRGTLNIITSSYAVKYKNGKWDNIESFSDYNMQEFNIYDDNSYLGEYKMIRSNKFYLYGIGGKKVNYKGNIFAYNGSLKMKLFNYDFYNETNDEDENIAKEAIKKAKIKGIKNYKIREKVILDIDNDGVNEIIYVISNNLMSDPDSLDGIRAIDDSTIFTLLFMYKDNNIYVIDKKVDPTISKTFELSQIVDIKEDNSIELIYLSKYIQLDEDICPKIYDLTKRKEIHNFCDED